MRKFIDRLLRTGIKLCLLTGVAFTFAACYGPAPIPEPYNAPDFDQAQQKLEQQLQAANQVDQNIE